MRVLWICGLPRVVQEQVFAGQDHGAQSAWSWVIAHLPSPNQVELHLACLWPGGNKRRVIEYKGTKIYLLPSPRHGRAMLFFQRDTSYFRSLFEELKPDLIHGWGTEDSYGLVARKLAPFHHVIGIQGLINAYQKYLPKSYRTLLVKATERLTLKKARNVVAESQYSLNSAAPLCPSAVKRVIEHPLRHEFLDSQPSDATARTVLFLGSIEERKGITDAISAFSQVAPEDWNLHVVGAGTPENESRMNTFVRKRDIAARFRHSRKLDTPHLITAMQKGSVFLLPSRIDTGPTALKEALTMGLWPVCYDNSGPGEYIRKYAFGSLAKDQDMPSLCQKLKDCLTGMPWKDLNKRTVLARRTRLDFSRERAWEQLIEFYQMIVSSVHDG
jgi:glycosyltransferase involved in cell wall biosynthesis